MSTANEAIVLNATIEAMRERMVQKNALLSVLAEDQRDTIYSDILQIAGIIRGNSVEQNARLFPHGDQIIIPWKDMDDANHNTDATAYQVPLNILGHRNVTLETGEVVPGMFVQWHFTSPYGVQFSNYQAFANLPEGLAAGQYYITIGANWGTNAVANTSWSFTLTQDVPAGGRLSGFEGMPDQASTNWKVKSWATPGAAAPIETVNVVSGATGTELGTLNMYTGADTGINGMQNVAYGHNRWGTSAIRQYLNASGNNWWASKEDFDIRPNEYGKKGFLSGFSNDFLSAIKPVQVNTALNTVEGFADNTETTYDKFFLPSLEELFVTPQLATVEGPYFPYWKDRLGLTTPAGWHPNIYQNLIHYAINAQTSAQNVRLRSADRGNSYGAWYVISSGYVSYNYAYLAFRFSPVCVIC